MRFFISCIAGTLVFIVSAAYAVQAVESLPPALDKAINHPLPTVNFKPAFDAGIFVATIDNPYFPLKPNTALKYSGIKGGQAITEDFHITADHKTIMGVNCTVVHDAEYAAGSVIEDTQDWYAQDKAGNVWYFGEQTRALDKGKWTTEGSWQAGVEGARPGIYMQAHPNVGDTYEQEFYDGRAGDSGSVLSLDEPINVPYGSYRSAQLTMEWAPEDPGGIDAKYWVKGVGVVKEFAATGATETLSLDKVETGM